MNDRPTKAALVVCYSNLATDPRVVRQIDWLVGAGWQVDTLGLGPTPRPDVRHHFPMTELPRLLTSSLIRGVVHALLPKPTRFDVLLGSRIPAQLRPRRGVRGSGPYDLVLVNDIDLLPWALAHGPALVSDDPGARIHLDVHEYHRWAPSPETPFATRALMGGYHRWTTAMIGSPAITSRSTVADGIADLYAADFGIDRPSIVRNSPGYVELAPRAVDPERIELVYHGNAEMARGLDLLIDAVRLLDERYHLNLMLTGSADGRARLRELTRDLGDRVEFHDPVPMADVPAKLNAFDLEVIFYPPTSPNFLHSFPNKFFEAVQGRIGVVIGGSPSMEAIVRRYGNGIIVDGWTAADLARTLNETTVDRIDAAKRAADACAHDLNSDVEGAVFLREVTGEVRR
ncbi:glycosyltransferase [Agromyces sp. NPDC049794]|uniref:glycosyltransferase n=1 Tax=unclassified Agromyces TaxID=2639701 RepID=UPI00340986B7